MTFGNINGATHVRLINSLVSEGKSNNRRLSVFYSSSLVVCG
jgi:hypothetical protein